MFNLRVSEISSLSGDMNDGVVVGRINQSNPSAVLLGESLVSISQVFRKDITLTGKTWVDLTTEALNAAAGDFSPFGSAGNMSVGDVFYIRTLNNEDAHNIYAQIAAAGAGVWTLGVQEWNTQTKAWESVVGLVDTSNGFKAGVGVYKLSYTSGTEGLVRLDDDSPEYIWHRIVLSSFTSVSVAPVLSRIWMADTLVGYKNVTTAFISTDYSSLPTEILPRIGDCLIIVHPGPSMGEDIIVSVSASTNYTTERYYLNGNNVYTLFSGVTDESNKYTVSPSGTERKARWTLPSDWVSKSITDRDGIVHTGWIECLRITAILTEGPVAPLRATVKSRSFGASNTDGIHLYSVMTVKAVSIPHIGIPSTTPVVMQLLNMSTGQGSSFTIPANATSLNVDITDLSLAVGDKLGLTHQSGGIIRDLSMVFHS